MNKIYIIAFIALSFTLKEKNAPNIRRLIQSEYKTTIENGSIIMIYNGLCKGGLCGSKLNKFLLDNITISNKDSIYFLVLNYEKNLIDTLQRYNKSRIIYTNNSALNKFSIYEQESTAIRIKNNEITHSTKIYQGIRFNKWSF